jgi:hypothetical protein
VGRKAYIVVGPESSGTRVVTRLLVEAGCVGVYSHKQPLDAFVKSGKYSLDKHGEDAKFVLRRSIPHGTGFPDLKQIEDRFKSHGCATTWILILREWTALALSKVGQGHARSLDQARAAIQPQYYYIFNFIGEHRPNFIFVDTSFMFVNPDRALRRLEQGTGLKFNKKIINDADKKHEAVNG